MVAQLQSAAIGWATDIYLQANPSTTSAQFYTHLGFTKMKTNGVHELPEDWQQKINKEEYDNFYIKFVTDETNRKEANLRASLKRTQVDEDEFLQLYHLSRLVCSSGSASNSSSLEESGVHKFLPTKQEDVMLEFPFKDFGKRVDSAGKSLTILGNPLFNFTEDTDIIKSVKRQVHFGFLQSNSHERAVISVANYSILKNDIGFTGKYKQWFSGEHLALSSQYLLHNKNLIITDTFDLIWSDIISTV